MVVKLKHARITRSVRAGSRIEGQVNRSGALAADVIVLRLEPTADRLCTFAGDLRVIWPSGFRATAEGTGILDETGRLVYRAGDARSSSAVAQPHPAICLPVWNTVHVEVTTFGK